MTATLEKNLIGEIINPSRVPETASEFVTAYFRDRSGTIEILEAGCGKNWSLKLPGIAYRVTGVDSSRDALDKRVAGYGDLDETILGDLTTVELPESKYDMVYCSYVLEHVPHAEQVLDKFFKWLKPNGVVVLLIPDRETVYGFITRFTPFWFHVFYYKYVRKKPHAGQKGAGPFPTYYDPVVSVRGIQEYCARHGHKIRMDKRSDLPLGKIFGWLAPFVGAGLKAIELVSFGALTSRHNNLLFVIEKGTISPR